MKKLFFSLLVTFFATLAMAQKMEFTFSNLSGVKTQFLHDGTTLVQLPAGSSLTSMSSYGMSVKADGATASLSDIVPNPSTTSFTDGALNVFYYKGKAYKVRFAVGEYFTAVFFSDALLGSASSMSKADFAAFADRITKMGTANGPSFEFSALPGYTPTTGIAFYLGDMNATSSPSPIIHTLDNSFMNVVNKCAVVAGQIESTGTSATVTEYGLCYGTSANPTTSNTYKAAADLGGTDATFGDTFQNIFGVYFDNLTGETTYHVRAYCKYTLSGSSTVYTTYGEDRTFTTPPVSGFNWHWEGGETPPDAARARIEEAMNGASEYYNNYCTLYKWCGTAYNSGVQTADCSLRSDNSCYIRFGPGERYQWVGTAQHEISHGYGVGQTRAFSGYPNPFQFKVATLTLRVFLRDMTMLISHDGQHYWPGGINQREEVTNGTANNKGTYTCRNEEMLKCNAMILNGMAKDGMQTTYGWVKDRNVFEPEGLEEQGGGPNKVSKSNNASATDFEDALDAFNQAQIPLILAPGDLDLAATASSDGYTLNEATYNVVTRSITEAQNYGVSDVTRFSGTTLSNTVQPQPFAFKFKDVRFYNGMKLWFDKPMYRYSNTSYRSLTPDLILSNLTTYVSSHASETSIWMQHIPFAADDNTWVDNTGTVYRYNNGTTAYNNNSYNATYNAYNTAARRRTKLSTLISSTANAAMFSGHAGSYNDNNYNNQFHDYTVAGLNNTPCDAYIVLMKAGTGVVEVKPVSFRNYQPYVTQYDNPATEYTANENNALLAGLVQGLTNLNAGNASINSALSTAQNVNTAANVTSSISALNTAFNSYVSSQNGDVDVSGILGTNLDFELAAGAATNSNIHAITGWNEYVNLATTDWGMLKYDNSLGSPNGGNALYIRENWKGNPSLASTLQVYKDAVLPAGSYLLEFEIRQPASNVTESLNYYELNGVRTTFTAGSSWETKTIPITVNAPTTLRLSFGFVGTTAEGNRPSEVNVDNIKLIYTQQEVTQGKASMTAPWELMTAKPNDYSPYFFTIWDHTQDLALVIKAGVHQGNQTMWYTEGVTPAFDKTSLWTFDSNVDGGTEYVVMTNATYPHFMFQTEWQAAYNYRTNDNGAGDISWGRTIHAFANGRWTVQNGKYPSDGYLGPWDNVIQNNAEVALNKTGANIGYFDIYRILRGEYVANFENIRDASLNSPLDITYVLENPGAERRTDIGWKTDGAGWWTQGSTALNGKVGSFFMESWNGSGLASTDLYQVVQGLPDGTYRFSAIAHCTSNCIMYANDHQVAMPTNNPGTRTNIVFNLSGGTLRVGFKTGTNPGSWIAFDDVKLEFLGAPDEYNVGAPEISLSNNDYIQQIETVTYDFVLASSTDEGSTFAILNNSAKVYLKQGSTTVAQGNLSLNGNVLTATFSGVNLSASADYTLELPADVVGYAGHVANQAVILSLHTPALFDNTYYLYNNSAQKYISRNATWNTQAIVDDYGLAIKVETDRQGNTHLRCFDNNLFIFDDGNLLFADGGTPMDFTPAAITGGYMFKNKANNLYLGVDGTNLLANRTSTDATSVWTLEPLADHAANYIRNADAQAVQAASDAQLTGVTTAQELSAILADEYIARDIAVTGAKEEKYEQYAATEENGPKLDYFTETVSGLQPGIYRLSADAFQRAAYNERVAEAGGARGLLFLFANDAKTQLKSVMEYGASTAYDGDFEYNGLHYPNTETSAYTALETGNYSNEVYVYVPADNGSTTGSLTFGIEIENRMGNGVVSGTWAVYDNFKLEYLEPLTILDELSPTAPAAATNATVKLKRTIIDKNNSGSTNAWNTICFPFALTAQQVEDIFGEGTVVKELKGVNPTNDYHFLTFSDVQGIAANTPYIMQVEAGNAKTEYIIEGLNITPGTNLTQTVGGVDFVGNYINPKVMDNSGGIDYYILNDEFKSSTGRTKIKGFRAYFHVPEGSGIKALRFNFDGDATSIEAIDSDNVNLPADIYNVGGQLVRKNATSLDNLPAGIYFINGKKVLKR